MRSLVFFKTYFFDFFITLDDRTKEKIKHALHILENHHFVPQKFVKHISSSNGIYELRVSVGNNEYRILFFFESGSLIENGKIVIIGNGFIKKDNRDYRRAVQLAEAIKDEYFARLTGRHTDTEPPDEDLPGLK